MLFFSRSVITCTVVAIYIKLRPRAHQRCIVNKRKRLMSLKQSSTTMGVYSLTQVVYHSSEIGIGASSVFKKFTGRRPVIVFHETVHFLVNMFNAEWK